MICRAVCLAIVFGSASIVLENELRGWVISPGKVRPRILELAVQIVELEHQEVILLIVKVLCRLEVDGHVILDGHVEDVIQVVHDLRSVLGLLVDHPEVRQEFLTAAIAVGWAIEEQDAC